MSQNTAAHTAGPWSEEATGSQPGAFSVTGDGNQLVALVYGRTREEQRANARLITAAPELLAAALAAFEWADRHMPDNLDWDYADVKGKLSAAIAAAKGGAL